MTTLYPIGTQLITRRLSQAALANELGFLVETEHWGQFYNFFDTGADSWERPYNTWRVTVTEENQKWLSPVPIAGDMMFPCVIHGQDGVFGAIVNDPNSGYWYRKDRKIILRTYPNGQRAPLIEWDEVILPEGAVV